ncbi:fibronectin type III domain-containing protein [Salinibacterium sp. PAMC 21357]|uniref:fibronectin type III domain-containing protein n=1 Tax=Salinibacterium sp. PAMC 21357 TaxID=1112215 RepID=UPI001146620E|nr:fibronectin type III domain-containing protein [Salinibacterium sp. PAMC 21357]
MKRSTLVSITAGAVIFLSLVSSISYASWTASSSKTATATAGTVAMTTVTSGGTASVASLGPFTYNSTNSSTSRPITVRNTGSVAASVRNVSIETTGSLSGAFVAVKFWAATGSTCAAAPSTSAFAVTTSLSDGTVSLAGLNMVVPVAGSSTICASTTFTESLTTQAGTSLSSTFVVRTLAGTSWVANDAATVSNRTFTQSIAQSTVPNAPMAISCSDVSKNQVVITWQAPGGFATPNGGYNIYFDGTLDSNTSNTSTTVEGKWLSIDVTIRAVAANGTESVDSSIIQIRQSGHGNGISCEG